MRRLLVCPFGNVNLLVSLCERLRQATSGRIAPHYACFTRYEREIYRAFDLPHTYFEPNEAGTWLPARQLDAAVAYSAALAQRHLGANHLARLQGAANHYAKRLACEIERGGFEEVLLFNGRHNLFVAVLDQIAELFALPKLVFEQGLFRPDYLTIDGQGVNARNSIDTLSALFDQQPFSYQTRAVYQALVGQLPLAANEPRDLKRGVGPWQLSQAYAATKLQPKWRLFLRSAENRDLLEAACWPRGAALPTTNLLPTILADARYDHVILCPLQVETDTQIVLHSPRISHMQQLIDEVSRAVAEFNRRSHRRACVIFKAHPLESRPVQVSRPDTFLIQEASIAEILRQRCDLLITINSTAGIEAIEAEQPVLTLGDAFYNFPGVVAEHCEDLQLLDRQIEAALVAPANDPQLQRRFIVALKQKYQVRLRTAARTIVAPPIVTTDVLATSPAGV